MMCEPIIGLQITIAAQWFVYIFCPKTFLFVHLTVKYLKKYEKTAKLGVQLENRGLSLSMNGMAQQRKR